MKSDWHLPWGGILAALAVMSCSQQHAPSPTASAPSPAPASMAPMASAPGAPASLADWARGAQIFEGMGTFHRKISSSSADAQQYFDQGMRFMWAFNHDEASRSFARAAQLDPQCGICLWGVALTVGPNYNMAMMAEPRAKVAFESLQHATAMLDHASPAERALINALKARYPNPRALDPSNEGPVLTAYADAMRDAAKQFPNDADIQTMYAESLMNTNAWKLWTLDGKAAAGTDEIVKTLESVLSRDPSHPGANHYYIHATEASPHPEKAIAAAERLRGMMPAAGHLEHMPAHTMQRVGRYEDAAEANRKGAAADRIYLSKTQPPDYYAMYVAHNFQFLAYATAMQVIPVRHMLGAQLIKVGQFARAESVYRQDLARNPNNGWSLFGLAQALHRQGKTSEGAAIDGQFAAAWKQADVILTASVF